MVLFFKKWEYDYNLDRWYKETLLKELSGRENVCILEAGCGEGSTASQIYSNNNKFYLLDISGKALEAAKSRFKKDGFSGQFIKGSIFEFPFKSNSFDTVLSIGMFEHFQKNQH